MTIHHSIKAGMEGTAKKSVNTSIKGVVLMVCHVVTITGAQSKNAENMAMELTSARCKVKWWIKRNKEKAAVRRRHPRNKQSN